MEKSESIKEITKAICLLQAEITNPPMKSKNPFFSSKYADLPTIINHCKPLLIKNELSILQTMYESEHGIGIKTTLLHITGEYISSNLTLKPSKNDPQQAGSAITYGRRYGYCGILGIVGDPDDDGNDASGKNKTAEPDKKGAQKPTPKPDRSLAFSAIWNKKANELKMPKGSIGPEMLKFINETLTGTVGGLSFMTDRLWEEMSIKLKNDPTKMEEYIHGVTFIENLEKPSNEPKEFLTHKEYHEQLDPILKRLNGAKMPDGDAGAVLVKGGYLSDPKKAMPNERKPILELLEELAGQVDA